MFAKLVPFLVILHPVGRPMVLSTLTEAAVFSSLCQEVSILQDVCVQLALSQLKRVSLKGTIW